MRRAQPAYRCGVSHGYGSDWHRSPAVQDSRHRHSRPIRTANARVRHARTVPRRPGLEWQRHELATTPAIRIHHRVPLAAFDLLAGIYPQIPPVSVVFTLWLSNTAAVGLAPRPARSRSCMTNTWLTLSHIRSSRRPATNYKLSTMVESGSAAAVRRSRRARFGKSR